MEVLNLAFRTLGLSEVCSEELSALERKEKLRLLRQPSDRSSEGKYLRRITLDEVAWHDTADSCWLVIYDYVYDCTEFVENHPGGSDILLEYAGRDGTLAFIGTGHSTAAKSSLDRYLIGELPPEERIFRVSGGVKIVGL